MIARPALFTLALSVTACGKSSPSSSPLPADLFAKRVEPPAPLAKVRGMTKAQVKQLYPEAKDDPNVSGSRAWMIDAPAGLRYTIVFYDDIDRVASTSVQASGHDLTAAARKAWGAGNASRMHPDWTDWRDETTGYTATATNVGIDFRGAPPIDVAYFGKAPALLGAYKTVKLGTPKTDVKESTDEQPEGVRFDPRFDSPPGPEALNELQVAFPRSVAEMLATAWGPGMPGVGGAMLWIDEATGTRATLADGTVLLVTAYSPYASLFGDGKTSLGRVPVDLDGKPRPAVEAALRQSPNGVDNVLLSLPPTKYGSRTHVDCSWPGIDKKKAWCDLNVSYEQNTKDRDEMLAYLDAAWGAPAKRTGDDRRYKVAGKEIDVSDWSGSLKLSTAR